MGCGHDLEAGALGRGVEQPSLHISFKLAATGPISLALRIDIAGHFRPSPTLAARKTGKLE